MTKEEPLVSPHVYIVYRYYIRTRSLFTSDSKTLSRSTCSWYRSLLTFILMEGQIQQCLDSSYEYIMTIFLCRMRSTATLRDHFVYCLSVHLSVALQVSHSVKSDPKVSLCFADDTFVPWNTLWLIHLGLNEEYYHDNFYHDYDNIKDMKNEK